MYLLNSWLIWRVIKVKYRIEFADRRCCSIANSRKELIERLQTLDRGTVEDIRKVYKSGVSDSVKDIYDRYTK